MREIKPKLPIALHDAGVQGVGTVVNVARQASGKITSAAQFANDRVIKPTTEIIGGQATSKPMQQPDYKKLQQSV